MKWLESEEALSRRAGSKGAYYFTRMTIRERLAALRAQAAEESK